MCLVCLVRFGKVLFLCSGGGLVLCLFGAMGGYGSLRHCLGSGYCHYLRCPPAHVPVKGSTRQNFHRVGSVPISAARTRSYDPPITTAPPSTQKYEARRSYPHPDGVRLFFGLLVGYVPPRAKIFNFWEFSSPKTYRAALNLITLITLTTKKVSLFPVVKQS